MLSALVGLPAAWIYYGPLPPEAQRIVDRFIGVAREAIGWNRAAAPATNQRPQFEYLTAASPAALQSTGAAPSVQTPAAPAFAPPAVGQSATAPPGPSISQRVEPLLRQLRQLGVAEYVLERWGDGRLYRFRCAMPLGEGPNLTQQFEAVAAEPEKSVEDVVQQIASWTTARRDAGLTR
ncbi:MAG: hypothetical protein DCC67_18940 [Planctomycetota bacterium]|nr:MAG: hypothetical protein DCC67_18940 [Planctomycetota bacterium]